MASFTLSAILCIAIISMAKTEFCQGPCPDGWVAHNARCFQYVHKGEIWIDAELKCLSLGGNLASVWSEEDDQFLKDLQRQMGDHGPFWIGLSDIHKEGTWLWSDGSRVEFTRWNSGEPNNVNGEHCVFANSGKENGWNDVPCNKETHAFLCSLRLF